MLRRFAAALLVSLLSIAAWAAPTTSTVSFVIATPSGAPITAGTISAELSQGGTTADGAGVIQVASKVTAAITSSGFTLNLVPNDRITPANTFYKISIQITAPVFSTRSETWQVPYSATTLNASGITRLNLAPGISTGPYALYVATDPTGACLASDPGRVSVATKHVCVCPPLVLQWDCTASTGGTGVADPGSDGIMKRTALNVSAPAVAGTDYVVPAGNTATATALAANGTNCSGGQVAIGVDASGNAEGCVTPGGGMADPGSNAIVKRTSLNVTAPAVAGTDYVAPGGLAGTAGALAANGTNCSGGQVAVGVDASGNAEGCFTPPGSAPSDAAYNAGTWDADTANAPSKNAVRDKVETLAPLASPALTSVPTAPTAAADTNTTQLATTAFVIGQAGAAAPLIDGTATVGASLKYSRQDHIHPTDTSRQALDADLTAIAAFGATGFSMRIATDSWAQRTLAAGSTKVTITNPAGVAGNPTIDVPDASATQAGAVSTAGQVFAGSKTFNNGAIAAVGQSLAVASGCTMDTGVACPASATEGGFIELPEDSDLGAFKFKFGLGASNLSADTFCNITAGGLIPASCVTAPTTLANNGTNCSTGQAPTGVDAQGNAEGCANVGGGSGVNSIIIHENIASPGAATARVLLRTTQAINIDSIYAALTGTTSSTWDLLYARAADASTVGQVIGTDAVTSSTAGVSVTATNPVIPKDAYLWYKASAVSGSPSNLFVQVAYSAATSAQCNDGIDNDSANGIDYPADSGCTSATDNTEGAASDTTAPEAIADLAASSPSSASCVLNWTAPHEDGSGGGNVTAYDCRVRAGTTFVGGDFASATPLTGEPTPSTAGSAQSPSFTASGLSASTAYAFACKSDDEVPNTSAISNATTCTTTASVTADLLDETFNNATNYDDGLVSGGGGWTEVTASGGVIDPNETTLCLTGTGFSSQCLESTAGATNRKASTENTLAASQTGVVKIVVYFGIHAMGAPTDGASQIIVEGRTTAAASPSLGSAAFGAQLYYDVDGTGDGITRTTCSSAPCWRIDMRIGGTDNTTAGGRPEILPDTIYRMEWTVDQGANVGEAKLGSTTILSSTDSSFALQYLRLGISEFSVTTETILFDWFKVDSTNYVEAP